MVRLIGIAVLTAMIAVPAQAQTRRDPIGATQRQTEPVTPGTTTVPGRVYSNRSQKALESPSSRGGGSP